MKTPLPPAFMAPTLAILMALSLCFVPGCDGPSGTVPNVVPGDHQPSTVPEPGPPVSPLESGGEDVQAEAVSEISHGLLLTEELVTAIQRGMTPEEVEKTTGLSGVPAGGDGKGIEVLRYADGTGNYFTARFDDGALRTRSGLRRENRPQAGTTMEVGSPAHAAATAPPQVAGDRPVAEIAPGVFIPLERAIAASSGQPRGVENLAPPAREVDGPAVNEPALVPALPGPAVVVAGGRRGARVVNVGDGGNRSYRPRASLPAFKRSLRDGRYEIRFVNPEDAAIQVGLRQENLGLDATVPPGAHASLKVDRGVYELFFVREKEPYTLYEADPITIDGFRATDLEVRLDPDDVHVQLIDYGQPE